MSITVMLAEDDVDDQELLQEALLFINPQISVHACSTGRKFIQELEGSPTKPHLLILDFNIPEMNGAQILEYLKDKNHFEDVVKIVWSTSPATHYMNTCLSLGASAYFVKPSTLSSLNDIAREMLKFVR